jgi:hypothetical protein
MAVFCTSSILFLFCLFFLSVKFNTAYRDNVSLCITSDLTILGELFRIANRDIFGVPSRCIKLSLQVFV